MAMTTRRKGVQSVTTSRQTNFYKTVIKRSQAKQRNSMQKDLQLDSIRTKPLHHQDSKKSKTPGLVACTKHQMDDELIEKRE